MGVEVYFFLVNADKYRDQLLPAYHAFVARSETAPLWSILQEAISTAESPQPNRPGFIDFPSSVYEEFGAILEGEQYYSRAGEVPADSRQKSSGEDLRFFVKTILAPSLLAVVCVQWTIDLNPWQKMSDPELTKYLYTQSRWVEDRLTFAKEFQGEIPEIVIGEWSRFLSDDEVKTMEHELSKMSQPTTDGVASEYRNLRAMCRAAPHGGNARVLACIL